MSIEVKPEHAGVLAVAVASWFVHHGYMAGAVMSARKKYEVKYPDLYATKDNCPNEEYRKAFNCVQRGHQNSLENLPTFLNLLTIAGVKYPLTAAVAGGVYLLGRVLYFKGYSTGKPDNRLWGAFMYFGTFTLLGAVCKWAYTLGFAK